MNFITALHAAWTQQNSLLCVGLDPDPSKFPAHLKNQKNQPEAIFEFCQNIVDATADLVCCFKPQIAYFAAHHAEDALSALIAHIHHKHPGIPVILDAKRGDIGSTAEQYAVEIFERYQADAITANPYMGRDSVAPYLAYAGKGVILLCRTSNPGGSDLQSLDVFSQNVLGSKSSSSSGAPVVTRKLYEHVASIVANEWNESGQCALVVGATFPEEIARVRAIVGNMPLLVPGIGAQGGDIRATVQAGQTAAGCGLMINSSRAILYAGVKAIEQEGEGERDFNDQNYAVAARRVALETRDAINAQRACANTPCIAVES